MPNAFEIMQLIGLPHDIAQMMGQTIAELEARATHVVREGKTVTIPPDMTYDNAIKTLQLRKDEEEREYAISETIEAFPFDAAYCLSLVMTDEFGFNSHESSTVNTMFGPMEWKPQFISVEIAAGKFIQVPWGNISIPGIEGKLAMGFAESGLRAVFKLSGSVKGKHRETIAKFVKLVREKLKTHSIYKGQAIKVSFRGPDGKLRVFSPDVTPKFMDLSAAERPVFTQMTRDQIETSILNTIRYTARLKANGVPVKRTVLLEGDFGTGKTLQALETAREAMRHGWTFLYVDNCGDLEAAMQMAEQYAPCCVFTEDVDRVMGGERDEEMDKLSYVLDGVDSKCRELLLILTTNSAKKMQQLMLRPGRIDSVISIQKPDVDTVYRLLKTYAKDMLAGDEQEFKKAIEPMVGQNAAFIAEVVKKAKLSAIARDEKITLVPHDIAVTVALIRNHMELMKTDQEHGPEQEVPLADLVVRVARNGRDLVTVGGNGDGEDDLESEDD